jgi:hypothetical protein
MADGARAAAEAATEAPVAATARAPDLLAPQVAALLSLQRSAGNAAVNSLLRSRRLARAPSMPGFSQRGDTCGAASMVTALFLWDLERASASNAAVVHACDLVLTANDNDPKANKAAISLVESVRAQAMTGTKLGPTEYQALSTALAVLYNGHAGMSSEDMFKLAKAIGFRPSAFGGGDTVAQILASDAVVKLKPGEVGQLRWIIADTKGGHAMLLGRHDDGTWFFSDQGATPAKEIQRGSREELVSEVVSYAANSWLYAGSKLNLQSIPPPTGFQVLTQAQSFLNRGPSLITPGEKLAEIDADWTTGEVLEAWDYRSRHDSLPDAKAAIAADRGGHGGVIVERPKGMFHIYKTSPLKDKDNLKETKIDASDSKDMVLVKRIGTFVSVWLVLSDSSGNKSAPFAVKP